MFGKPQGGAKAYANVGLETAANAASPHQLIAMLFEGALVAISTAMNEIEAGTLNPEIKGTAVTKATRILNEGLRASLDRSAGGALADQLDALYHFIGTELVIANASNDLGRMGTAKNLLSEIADAWKAIEPNGRAETPQEPLVAA